VMSQVSRPRLLAVACWSEGDWLAVYGGEVPRHGEVVTLGFWLSKQPRWLHLSAYTCTETQRLLDTGLPSGRRAAALSTVLHEAVHAHGIRDEAQTNCYAVQLVSVAAEKLRLTASRAAYLGNLARRYVRARAPAHYWNRERCRDGGPWDLFPDRKNLRS
jgi:hypothetical protein